MKRLKTVSRFLAIAMVCGCCMLQNAIITPLTALAASAVATVDGYAFFEAENTELVPRNAVNFTNKTVAEFSGGAGITTSAGQSTKPAVSTPGDISFTFKPDVADTYYVWVRIKPTRSAKSAWIGVNSLEYGIVVFGGVENTTFWINMATVKNAAANSSNTIKLIPNNTYFDLDAFCITNAKDKMPSGITGELIPKSIEITSSYPKPTFTPPPVHPRLYFQQKDIPAILANAKKSENTAAWNAHVANLSRTNTGVLATPAAGKSNDSPATLGYIESWAFEYVTQGVGGEGVVPKPATSIAQGQKAVAAIKNYAKTVVYIDPNNDGYTRNAGHLIFTIAQVYDWCYPLLTDDDKLELHDAVENLCTEGMEVGWPPIRQGAVTGHGSEAQTLRDMMSAAIAFYDERPDIYNVVGGRFFAQFVEARKYYYPGHWPHQGLGYGSYRGQWDFNSTFMMDRLGLPDVYGLNEQGNSDQQQLMYWFLYMRRPDGQQFRDGDVGRNGRTIGQYWTDEKRTLLFAANYYNDEILKGEFNRQGGVKTFSTGHGNTSCVEALIFNNPDLGTQPITNLPKTEYYGPPMGNMIARTGWDTSNINSNDTVAMMKLNEMWFANHMHLDAGHFQLYYKGILASETGRYETYGNEHDYNYNKRTIAHNTVLVMNPNESMQYGSGTANDGGQRATQNGKEVSVYTELLSGGYKSGTNLGHEFGPDPITPEYSYIKGDITAAYTSKVENFDRGFVFLNLMNTTNPAALIVFDKVASSDASFKKTWLLHGLYEPQFTGNTTVFRNDVNGYNGKLTVDTLLPKADNTTITKNGGVNQFWVNGINYPGTATINQTKTNESDGWRIEVSPKTASKEDYFLNVLQVGTSNPDTPALPATLIESDTLVGVSIADRVVMYAKSDSRTNQPVSFTFAGTPGKKILVEGLKEGIWRISNGATVIGNATASADGGVVYFTGDAGSYTLTYIGHMPMYISNLRIASGSLGASQTITISANVSKVDIAANVANSEVFIAIYHQNGAVAQIYKMPYTTDKEYAQTYVIPSSYSGGMKAKMFVWDGSANLVPLAKTAEITL